MIFKKKVFPAYTCLLLLLATLFGCNEAQSFANYKEANMKSICEIPEDISEFEALISNQVGQEISESDINLLKNDMDVIRDEKTIDPFYSRTEKVRFVVLIKKCIASDQVPYEFQIGALMDSSGNAIFSQAYLIYEAEYFLNGKRDFSFTNFLGSNSDYTNLISRNTVGLMDKAQFEKYMQSLGCSKLEDSRKDETSAKYLYVVEPEKHLPSRLAGWNFSKQIWVNFNSEKMVSKITVKGYN